MISLTIGKGIFTKAVQSLWEEFIKKYGNEIEVLINADIDELSKIHPKVAETINLFRKGKYTSILVVEENMEKYPLNLKK